MNRKFFGICCLTNAQAILILVAANLIAMGYLISLTNYNHDIGIATQKEIINLVNDQGNISTIQRQQILNEFENLPQGGLAGQNLAIENNHLLHDILGNITKNSTQ